MGRSTKQQRDNTNGDCSQHQSPRLDQVSQRHYEEQAQAVADLRERNDQASRAGADAERVTNWPGDRLRVIDVRDDEAARRRNQQNEPARESTLWIRWCGWV